MPKYDYTYNYDLDWLLNERDAECGYRSTLGGQIAAIERGGAAGDPNTDPYNESQLGWGRDPKRSFERDRRITEIWHTLKARSKQVHLARYTLRIPTLMRAEKPEDDQFCEWPKNIEILFGSHLAGVAMLLAHEDGKLDRLLLDCSSKTIGYIEKQYQKAKGSLASRARTAIKEAHEDYYDQRQRWYDNQIVNNGWSLMALGY